MEAKLSFKVSKTGGCAAVLAHSPRRFGSLAGNLVKAGGPPPNRSQPTRTTLKVRELANYNSCDYLVVFKQNDLLKGCLPMDFYFLAATWVTLRTKAKESSLASGLQPRGRLPKGVEGG